MSVRLLERRAAAVSRPRRSELAVAGLLIAAAGASVHQGLDPRRALLLTGGAIVLLALAVLALIDLERLTLVVLFCTMVFPQSLASPGGAHVALSDLMLLFVLGTWTAWFAVGRQPVAWLRGNRYLPPAFAFAAVTLVSVLWSTDRSFTIKQAVQIVELVVVVPVLYASIPGSLPRIRQALVAYVVFTTGLSLVVFTYFVQRAIDGDLSPEYLPGMHKNATGGFLGVGCVLAYGLWLEGKPGSRWVIWLLPLELAGLFGTISRGAMVGTAVAILFVAAVTRRRRLVTVGMLALATAIFLVTIQLKLPNTGYSSLSTRPQSWAGGVRWIEAHPLLGTGAGTYNDFLTQSHIGLTDPNNLFLLTWAELGIFGLLVLLALLYRIGRIVANVVRTSGPSSTLGAVVAAGALSNLVHFQFDTTWTRGTATITFALVGLLCAVLRLRPAPTVAVARPATKPLARSATRPSSSLRVLQLVASTEFTALERQVVRLSKGLRGAGVDCRIACPLAANGLRHAAAFAGIPVVPAAGRGPWLAQVLRLAETSPPQIVHVHDRAGAVAGLRVVELGGSRLVRTEHVPEPVHDGDGWRARAAALLRRSIDRRSDAVIAVSDVVARRRSTRATPVHVVPPGVELPSEASVERHRAAAFAGHPAVAYIGDLDPGSPLELLLMALARARVHLPRFRLVVSGTGRAEVALRRRADELGVAAAVDWLGGSARVSDVFRHAWFAVQPSPADSFDPLVVDAMAWGRPVVVPRASVAERLVEEGLTGLHFRANDVRDLGDAFLVLGLDATRVDALGRAARRVAVERFRVDVSVTKTIEVYEGLSANLPAQRP